jgi:sensor histidine kinase YesM
MTMHIRPFHSISRVSKWLVNWSIASIVTTFIFLVLASYQNIQFFSSNEDKVLGSGSDFILSGIDSVIGFVAFILTLYWYHRASKNVHAFGGIGITSNFEFMETIHCC